MKEVFRHVLVPYDGSTHSQKALDYAIRICKNANAKLNIVSVLDVSHLGITNDVADRFSPFYVEEPRTADVTERYQNRYSLKMEEIKKEDTYKMLEQIIDSARKFCAKKDIEAQTEIVFGPVAEIIVEYAEEKNIDLIVIGSRGYSGFKRLLMGHVSSDVAEKAHCPVLIIR